jgi:hypothetical protein
MSILDWISDISIGDVATVGMGVYDYMSAGNQADSYQQMAESKVIDPFGSERPYYQQQLRSLYNDPSYLENLPGYRFAMDQSMKEGKRQAAKTGHYLSSNLPQQLQDRAAGLASQMYGSEANRLATLAGAGINPNAGVYAELGAAGVQAGAQQYNAVGGALGRLGIGNFSEAQEGSPADIAAKKLKGAALKTGKSSLGDMKLGDVWNKLTGGGGDSPAIGMADTEFAAGVLQSGGDALSSSDAAIAMMDNEFALDKAAGTHSTGFEMPGGGMEGWSGAGLGMAALGGAAGGYLGSQLDKKTPIGGIVGTGLGAYGGGMAAYGAGMAGGATSMGAAGMAAAGPAVVGAALLQIGKGIYGNIQGARRKNAMKKEMWSAHSALAKGGLVDDPTGQDLGKGWSYKAGGGEFFLPEQHYKTMTEGGTIYDQGAAQGNYAWYNDPSGGWKGGQFGGDQYGAQAFHPGLWQAADISAATSEHQKQTQRNFQKESMGQWDSGHVEQMHGGAENLTQNTATQIAEFAAASSRGYTGEQKSLWVSSGFGEADGGHAVYTDTPMGGGDR